MTTQSFENITSSPHLKKRIMRGVYFHWFIKKYAPIFFIEFAVLLALFIRELSIISFYDLIENARMSTSHFSSLSAMISFFASAFINTSIMSKFLLFGISFVTVFIVRDTRRILKNLSLLFRNPRKATVRILS